MKAAETATSSGLLTQTSLQLDGVTSKSSAERVATILRRIPGVLLAEVNPTSGRVTVGHDEGVAIQSLLAGIQSAGCHAIDAAAGISRAGDAGAAQRADALRRRRLMVITLGMFVAILLGSLVPKAAYKEWLVLSLTVFAWNALYFYFADSPVRRLRS